MVVKAPRLPRVGRGVALGRLYSPGSMAGALWRATGLTAPLTKFTSPENEALGHWMEAAHGGWVTAEVIGSILPCLDADVRSAYPAGWSLAGWWDVIGAESVRETDVGSVVVELARRAAAGDIGVVLERAAYPTLGRTLCVVHPAGEKWPTERPGRGGARLVVAPVEGDPLYVTAADVVAAAYLSAKVPEVVSAVRLDPLGSEESVPVRLRDDVVIPAGSDPIPALIRLRPQKGGDERLRSAIRSVANAAAWGLFARLDPVWVDGCLTERPATWTWPPVAACVPALARLWLSAVERVVSDRGGIVVSRDTDGIAVVSLPTGGPVSLSDGHTVQAHPWDDLEELLSGFDALDPFGDAGSFWGIEHGSVGHPLHLLALAPKRYVEAVAAEDGWEVVGGTEHALGGGLVDPSAMAGRGPNRRHRWITPAAHYALERNEDPGAGFSAPWDAACNPAFPALARWSAGSPAALARVPKDLGAHPFAPLVEARVDQLIAPGAPVPMALDPGDDLSGWADESWVTAGGQEVTVSTGPEPGSSIPLALLANVAADWATPRTPDTPGPLTYDRRLARHVGRGGTVVDALLADPDGEATDYEVVYGEGAPGAYVAERAGQMGKRAFARRTGLPATVAGRAARGLPISAANVERALSALCSDPNVRRCALDGCEAPVARPNAKFCSKAHADRAYRARRRPSRPDPYASVLECRDCGCLMLGAADTGTGVCADCCEGEGR